MILFKKCANLTALVLCAAAIGHGEDARIVFTHPLPALDGKRLETKIVEVTRTRRIVATA